MKTMSNTVLQENGTPFFFVEECFPQQGSTLGRQEVSFLNSSTGQS